MTSIETSIQRRKFPNVQVLREIGITNIYSILGEKRKNGWFKERIWGRCHSRHSTTLFKYAICPSYWTSGNISWFWIVVAKRCNIWTLAETMKSQVRSPTSALFPACKVFSLHLPQQARRMSDQREKERRMHCLSTIKTIEVMAKLNDPTKVIYSRHSGQIIPKFESMLNQNTIVISQDEPYTQLKQSNEPKPKFPNYILAAMKPVLFSSLLLFSKHDHISNQDPSTDQIQKITYTHFQNPSYSNRQPVWRNLI